MGWGRRGVWQPCIIYTYVYVAIIKQPTTTPKALHRKFDVQRGVGLRVWGYGFRVSCSLSERPLRRRLRRA